MARLSWPSGVRLLEMPYNTSSSRFLGFGFVDSGHSPDLVRRITRFFRSSTPGGVYLVGGAPAYWRTSSNDADKDPGFVDVWLNEFDMISPWTVGRDGTAEEADAFSAINAKGDVELMEKRNQEGNPRRVDYMPVILPGGSVSHSPSPTCFANIALTGL